MTELQQVKEAVSPTDVLLAVDAMTGQEAAGVVKAFNDSAELTGMSMQLHNCQSSFLSWPAVTLWSSQACPYSCSALQPLLSEGRQ